MKNLLFVLMTMTSFSVFATPLNQIGILGNINDFVAPVIYGKSNLVAPQAGLIILDSSDNLFYGQDANNSWVPLGGSTPPTGYVEAKQGAWFDVSSFSGCAANTWCDLDSINLPSGTWSITAQAIYLSNGTTATTVVGLAVGTGSGTDTSGLADGDNVMSMTMSNNSGDRESITIGSYRVQPGSPTTYYLKTKAETDINNLQVTYRISAEQRQ